MQIKAGIFGINSLIIKKEITRVKILKVVSSHMAILVLGILIGGLVVTWLVLFTSADRQVFLSRSKILTHDGLDRTYRVYEPESRGKKSLIIGLHGLGGDGRQFAYYTALHNVTNEDTIVVYPDAVRSNQKGLKPGWNSTFCCGTGLENNIDDAGFILALIEKITSDYDIDESKIYLTGFSNGATMSQYFATKHPSKVAGIASISGSVGVEKKVLNPTTSIPILLAHGRLDENIPYKGGLKPEEDEFFTWIDFDTTVKTWRKVNNCSEKTKSIEKSTDREIIDYKSCDAVVRRVEYPNLGHKWDDWRTFKFWGKMPKGSKLVVEFFNDISS